VLLKTCFYVISFNLRNFNWFSQFFHWCSHSEHLFICKEDEVRSKLEKLLQKQLTSSAVRLSQLLYTSPLKAFQLQIRSYDADNIWFRNACLPWYFTDCAVSSLPVRLSTVPVPMNFFSNLLMLLVVHPLSGNSVLNCLALYCFDWYKVFC